MSPRLLCPSTWGGVFIAVNLSWDALAFERVPNDTLNLPLHPPEYSYSTEEAFSPATFQRPVAMVVPPGETNRLFVVEQPGRIAVVTNLASPSRSLFLDIDDRVSGGTSGGDEQGLLGLAFHPGYATNGFFYVFYTGDATTSAGGGRHDILSRFSVSADNPNEADAGSELRLILQRDEASNHNGGDLHFGSDGYLYVAVGDEGGANDSRNNSQRIDKDLFAGILRIDVDKRPGSLAPNPHPAVTDHYAIPPDNPFVGATAFNGDPVDPQQVRTEFWAVGLRNPWRMSFDRETGLLYAADVGQSAREEIDIITPGGNYGWAFREGTLDGPKAGQAPPVFVGIPPLLEYSHGEGTNQGRSVTGGLVYRGDSLPDLNGAYIFGDYVSGNIWALRHDGTNVSRWDYLTRRTGIAAFGEDPRNGDVLIAVLNAPHLYRLARVPAGGGQPLPKTLAEAGVFSDLESLTPHAGIVPYEVRLPFWSDNAIKSRWFSVPDTNLTIGFAPNSNWSFPTGTVWVKHMELELTNGVPESRHRLETRLFVMNDEDGYGITYRWGDSTTNATLVGDEGLDETFVVDTGGGILSTQVWRYPSRSECLACHTSAGGRALGFNTPQLNRVVDYSGTNFNQIEALADAGYFAEPVENIHALPALALPTDQDVSLEHRVRSYLTANCVQCHQPEGTAPGNWDARFDTPTAMAGLIDGELVDPGSNPDNRVIVRGSTDLSMLLQRISIRGLEQMPPLATSLVDAGAIELLSAWITNDLPTYQTFAEWQVAQFGSTNAPGAGPNDDFDGDRDGAYLEFLNGTDPKRASSRWRIHEVRIGDSFYVIFNRTANRGYEVQFSDNLADPDSWQPVNDPWNAPTFLSYDQVWFVNERIQPIDSRHFRVRVYER